MQQILRRNSISTYGLADPSFKLARALEVLFDLLKKSVQSSSGPSQPYIQQLLRLFLQGSTNRNMRLTTHLRILPVQRMQLYLHSFYTPSCCTHERFQIYLTQTRKSPDVKFQYLTSSTFDCTLYVLYREGKLKAVVNCPGSRREGV